MTVNGKNDDQTKSHVLITNGTVVSHYRIVEKIGVLTRGVLNLPGGWVWITRELLYCV